MDKQHIDKEVTQALRRLRSEVDNAKEEIGAVNVMWSACDAIDKGICGERALKALVELWRELELGQITGDSISEFRAVVDRLFEKSKDDFLSS